MSAISEVIDGSSRFAVICGDVTSVLSSIPDGTFHACYADPPYGLSAQSTDSVVACLTAWLAGEAYTHGPSGFMGKSWDAFVPGPEAWREVHRCLRPGGYCVAFSSTRTVDLLGIAVRLAGFEMRPMWSWVGGQGFPKSLDVSRSIDASEGAEREVIGRASRPDGTNRDCSLGGVVSGVLSGGLDGSLNTNGAMAVVTVPSSPSAVQWDGYGTDVKPAVEPLIVARKALDGTVAHNVQTHGCGALNIDAALEALTLLCRAP